MLEAVKVFLADVSEAFSRRDQFSLKLAIFCVPSIRLHVKFVTNCRCCRLGRACRRLLDCFTSDTQTYSEMQAVEKAYWNAHVLVAYEYVTFVGTKTQLVSLNDTIDGKTAKLPNSVALASDGTLYWTDSSSDMMVQDGVYTMLGDGSGRLIKYDPKTKTNRVLLNNIHFANGVVLSPNEDFVLVAETVRSRILRCAAETGVHPPTFLFRSYKGESCSTIQTSKLRKYYLKGSKQGTSDIFIDGLPGLPDNLKLLGPEGFLVSLVTCRDAEHPLFFQVLGPYPLLRKFLARIMALVEMPLHYINSIKPNVYTQKATHWIGHFESVSVLTPKFSSVIQLDFNGNVAESYHNVDGSLSDISDALFFNDALYLGSPFNTYLGRVKYSPKKPRIHVKSVKE